jgi:hypothetical protein
VQRLDAMFGSVEELLCTLTSSTAITTSLEHVRTGQARVI